MTALSPEEVARFNEQGVLGPFRAFSNEEMNGIREVICERVLKSPSPLSLYATQMRHLDSRTVWRICSAEAITSRLASLYGPQLMIWYSNFFDKSPDRREHTGEYPWHQDAWHWQIKPMKSLSVWLAITPATVENGCVEVLPGTHRQEIPQILDKRAHLAGWFGGMIADPAKYDERNKIAMVLEPGEFFIFSEYTLHHSNPNRSEGRRLGFSFRITTPDVRSDREQPCVMVCGRDQLNINPMAEPPQGEPDLVDATRSLADASNYRFDQALHGLGWHLPECDRDTWFRWTGPATNAWLDLKTTIQEDCELRCQILHAAAPDILEGLKVHVNDRPLELTRRISGRFVEVLGPVPREVLAQNPNHVVRIGFQVPRVVRPADSNSGNGDTRHLGIALAGIALTPKQESTPSGKTWWSRLLGS